MNFLNSVSMQNIPRAAEDGGGAGAGGAGAGAGGDKGAGAGSGADKGAGAGAGDGADKGAGGGAGAGSDKGGGDPWYMAADYAFDDATQRFFAGKNYPDQKTALTSLRQADELARARNVVPKPDPKNPQGWEGFTELGWTPDKTQYKFDAPKLADGDIHDDNAFTKFQGVAHELRLAPWQAKGVYDAMHKVSNDAIKGFRDAGATANRELDAKLREKWGPNFDQKKELATRAFSFFKVDGISGAMMDQVMGAPQMVELFEKIGTAMGEDKLITGDGSGMGSKTPATARAERLRLEGDANWMKVFNDPRHPQNKDYVAQRAALIEIEARSR